MRTQKGITLIELIICMMLMCIIISFETPLIFNYSAKRQETLLDETALELLMDLRLYQQKSMAEGCVYHIYFNNSNSSYMIYTFRGLQNCVFKQKKFPECVNFDSTYSTYGDNKLSFNRKGKPMPYPCTVALKNTNGQIKRIIVSIATDYIYIKDV